LSPFVPFCHKRDKKGQKGTKRDAEKAVREDCVAACAALWRCLCERESFVAVCVSCEAECMIVSGPRSAAVEVGCPSSRA